MARIYLLTNDWANAIAAAELALEINKRNIKAIGIKAEASFNVCQFERALVLFYRGMVNIGFIILSLRFASKILLLTVIFHCKGRKRNISFRCTKMQENYQ